MPILTLPSGHSIDCEISFPAGDHNYVHLNYLFGGSTGGFRLGYNQYAEEYVDAALPGAAPTPQVIIEQFNEYIKSGLVNRAPRGQFIVNDSGSQSYADCNLHYIKTDRGVVTDGNIDVYLLDTEKGTVITQVRFEHDLKCKVNPGFPDIDARYLQMIASGVGRYLAM